MAHLGHLDERAGRGMGSQPEITLWQGQRWWSSQARVTTSQGDDGARDLPPLATGLCRSLPGKCRAAGRYWDRRRYSECLCPPPAQTGEARLAAAIPGTLLAASTRDLHPVSSKQRGRGNDFSPPG